MAYYNKSKTVVWSTPIDLFSSLDQEFHFDLDPCSNDYNHLCDLYFTEDDDGLIQSWKGHTVFCNPPYGRVLKEWVKKAYLESLDPDTIVVLLLPVRTDTSWFHEYCLPFGQIRFLRGRLCFGDAGRAPFPSMVVVFSGR